MKPTDAKPVFPRHFHELFQLLVLGLTLEEDRQVQDALRPPDAERFCVRLDDRDCWIEVGSLRPAAIHRSLPVDLAEVVLPWKNGLPAALSDTLSSGSIAAKADIKAADILGPLASLTTMPVQRALDPIVRWAPAFEMAAYGAAASVISLLDEDRYMLFKPLYGAETKARRRQYWSKLTLAARLTLLSTPIEARRWLSAMATSFEWLNWTPSWMFIRERSLWLAAVAARSAASFGPPVVDKYLEVLERNLNPMKIFDAILGLTAIAISSPPEQEVLLEQVRRSVTISRARGALFLPTLHLAAEQAIATIEDPVSTERRSKGDLEGIGLRRSLFDPVILARDCTVPTARQRVPAITLLPTALKASISDFFPANASTRPHHHLGITDHKLRLLVDSAWTEEKHATPAAATVH